MSGKFIDEFNDLNEEKKKLVAVLKDLDQRITNLIPKPGPDDDSIVKRLNAYDINDNARAQNGALRDSEALLFHLVAKEDGKDITPFPPTAKHLDERSTNSEVVTILKALKIKELVGEEGKELSEVETQKISETNKRRLRIAIGLRSIADA